jgi:autoinducer 2-degrading protein
MYVVVVDVFVKAGHEEAFIEATEKNHLGTRQEPGNVRFDVLRDKNDPQHFCLYEVYRSEEALGEHKQTEHYATWRDTVADWMEKPRQGTKYDNLFPADERF